MMKNSEHQTLQVIEKRKPTIIPQLSKTVKMVVNHKTLEKIIQLSEEEKGID